MYKPFKRRITEAYFNFIRNQNSTVAITNTLVHRMANNYTEIEEFLRLADEALIYTIAEFDINNGGSFATLLYTKIRNKLRHARDVETRANRVSLVDSAILAGYPDKKNLEVVVKDCLDCLDSQARRVMTKIFFEGKTLREIAIEENTNHMAIFVIKRSALQQIRNVCLI